MYRNWLQSVIPSNGPTLSTELDSIQSIDEASKDDRTYARLWGRSEVGGCVEVNQPFVRRRRFSLVAALLISGQWDIWVEGC